MHTTLGAFDNRPLLREARVYRSYDRRVSATVLKAGPQKVKRPAHEGPSGVRDTLRQ